MLRGTSARCESSTFHALGRLPVRGRPLYPQQQRDGKKVMDAGALRAVTTAPRRRALAQLTQLQQLPQSEVHTALGEHSDTDAAAVTQTSPLAATASSSNQRGASSFASFSREYGDAREPSATSRRQGVGRLAARLRMTDREPFDVPRGAAYRTSDATPKSLSVPQLQPKLVVRPRRSSTLPMFAEDEDATVAASNENLGEVLLVGNELQDEDVILDTPVSLLQTCTSENEAPVSFTEEVRRAKTKHALRKDPRAMPDEPSLLHDSLDRAESAEGDDELVVDPYVEAKLAAHQHPSTRGISQDVIDLVTDAFTKTREREIERRRRALYELTHPNPSDYTYGSKLVPPPPLNFGKITDEAVKLGEELMLGQHYSLVNQAGVRADSNTTGTETSYGDDNMIEMNVGGGQRTRRQRAAAVVAGSASSSAGLRHRSRKREDNIFRDHNYFFEINDLYQEIVLVGKASAGKSSLINALLGQQGLAKTSSTPNTTRKINFYQSVTPEELHKFHEQQHHNQLVKLPGGGLQLTFVDMPGYGIEGMSDAWRDAAIELTDAYFGVRRSVNTVLFCVDCDRGLTKTDIKYFKWLENVQGVFYVVLTKCDSVPHSRVCSVMRQIYVLITKNRKKFRKVFPYIIPVSAKDGTNLDTLRGLITETSGMIPGDKLRDLLKQKKEATMEESLTQEALRLTQIREQERAEARAQFLEAYRDKLPADSPLFRLARGAAPEYLPPRIDGSLDSVKEGSVAAGGAAANGASSVAPFGESLSQPTPSSRSVFELDLVKHTVRRGTDASGQEEGEAEAVKSIGGFSGQGFGAGEQDAAAEERRRRRERFVAWRQVNPLDTLSTPYGKLRYRLNTGLDNPLTDSIRLEYEVAQEHEAAAENLPSDAEADALPDEHTDAVPTPSQALSPAAGFHASRVIGLSPEAEAASLPSATSTASTGSPGKVSQFLDTLEQFGHQRRRDKARNVKKWLGKGSLTPRLLVDDGTGRVGASIGGQRTGPALVDADTPVAERQAAWKARQLKSLLWKENAEAPWEAMQSLSRKLEQEKQQSLLSGMRRKERAAYIANAGKVTESFEKFEGEVTTAKYMNETRRAKTIRSQAEMHLNATAKINYRSMPAGLWKQYGQQDTYWPTPRVLGREKDESHATTPTEVKQKPSKSTSPQGRPPRRASAYGKDRVPSTTRLRHHEKNATGGNLKPG